MSEFLTWRAQALWQGRSGLSTWLVQNFCAQIRWVRSQGTDPEDTTSDFGLLSLNDYRRYMCFI